VHIVKASMACEYFRAYINARVTDINASRTLCDVLDLVWLPIAKRASTAIPRTIEGIPVRGGLLDALQDLSQENAAILGSIFPDGALRRVAREFWEGNSEGLAGPLDQHRIARVLSVICHWYRGYSKITELLGLRVPLFYFQS
jgi:hypothetical protein